MKLWPKEVGYCRHEMVTCAVGRPIAACQRGSDRNLLFRLARLMIQKPQPAHNWNEFKTCHKERPGDGVLVFYEAIMRIELGDRDAAFALLRSLQERKLGLVPVRDSVFEAVWNKAEFQKFREKLANEEPRTPDAPVAFRLGDPELIPEGIAYDPKQDRFFIGSVAQKKIVSANRKGEVKNFSGPGDNLDCVLGLFVDAAHEQLYQ